MAFKYRQRSDDAWEKRATQRGGSWEGYIKDEYNTYVPQKGEGAIRILPPTWEDTGPGHYGLDVWVHYSVGPVKATVICLFHMRKEACPVCEERVRAERANDEALAKEFRANRRVLVWLLNRKEPEKGVLAWGMPFTADRDLTKVCKDRTTGKYYVIDHPEQGYDVYFDKEESGDFPKYVGWSISRNQSSVDQQYIDYIEKNPLPDILLWRNYQEVKELLEGAKATEAAESPARTAPQKNYNDPERFAMVQRSATNDETDPPFDGGSPRIQLRPRNEDAPTPKAEDEPSPRREEPKEESRSGSSTAAALRERFARRS